MEQREGGLTRPQTSWYADIYSIDFDSVVWTRTGEGIDRGEGRQKHTTPKCVRPLVLVVPLINSATQQKQ